MHSSLVVTLSGLPLGLAAIKFWTCKKFSKRFTDRTLTGQAGFFA
jgi:hypothetical protein